MGYSQYIAKAYVNESLVRSMTTRFYDAAIRQAREWATEYPSAVIEVKVRKVGNWELQANDADVREAL